MGSACCGDEVEDEKSQPLMEQPGYTELTPIKVNKEVKRLVKNIGNVLAVILPNVNRMFPDASERENFKQLIIVLDRTLQGKVDGPSAERHEIINRACPPDFPQFREVLQDNLREMIADENKPRDGRRRSGTIHSGIGSAARHELPRLMTLWFDADEDCSGALSQSEVKKVLSSLNIQMSTAALKKLIQEVDSSNDGQLQFFEFMTLYENLTTVEDLVPIFESFAKPGSHSPTHGSTKRGSSAIMTRDQLVQFLMEYQRHSLEEAEALLPKFGPMKPVGGVVGITFKQFQNTLLDRDVNSWMHPKELKVHHDMTQPYTHYYIDCSHNTYLAGHQLTGESSCSMYRKALLNGCRCVELDCWDGSNGDPIVTHGHTITTKIRFYDVCVAINETAFKNSPYPVMLSLEIHTSVEQQRTMVKMMQEIFGSKLTDAAMAERTTLFGIEYSPEALKNKILIKAKRLKGKSSLAEQEEDDPSSPPAAAPNEVPKKDTHAVISQELSDATYTASYKFSTMEEMLTRPHYGVCSIDELKVEKWSKSPQPYIDLAKRFLLRVYPKGLRIDSTNFSPQLSWNIGAQLLAMNIQTYDEGMRLNRCKFKQNGQCGYILKPLCLRQEGVPRQFNDNKMLVVKVLCGIQLPKPGNSKKGEVIDPYVELFINGLESDDTSSKRKSTKVVDDNGFNPRWNEVFTFPIQAVELASLTIRVMEKDPLSSEFIGDNSMPLSSIREGVRVVPLYLDGDNFASSPTAIMCHFSWKDADPNAFVVIDDDLHAMSYRTVSGIPSPSARAAAQQARQHQDPHVDEDL